jgi:hypothetical protein
LETADQIEPEPRFDHHGNDNPPSMVSVVPLM